MTETGDIRDKLQALPNHHGGNGYMMQDLFTVRHDIIRELRPAPRSVFEFGALLGYFLVTALDAAPSIERVGWVDLELHTQDSNRLCAENLESVGFSVVVMSENGVYWRHRDDMPAGLQFDLVAVDSDHSWQGCLDDLRAAASLEPRWIMVDDWTAESHRVDVQGATVEWLEEQNELGFQWVVSEHVTANGLAVLTRAGTTGGGTR